ncbi:MAG: tat (twin-arginine translocation) pathway signal sequence [Opitutus sp.]|nr:tat (twin-arginine translocation) pathway signal sequence [Opitutus sp.]
MKTSRRDFLKTGLALAATLSAARYTRAQAGATPAPASGPAARPVLAAVRDGSRTAMLERALAELGGIGAFVQPGQSVLIKPNIGWDVAPERGANTHPEIVGRLVVLCREAGAKSVSVFDHTCDQWQRCYATSGIEQAVKDAGGIVVSGDDHNLYRSVAIPRGVKLQSAEVHQLVLDSDVFINVPVLKHHSGSLMTGAMKNLMGVVWDRRFYHRNDLHQCIADFLTFKRPTLNIMDAFHPMVRNGPRGRAAEDVVPMNSLLACTDIVAIDAAATRFLGHEPSAVRHISLAAALGLGTMDLNAIDIRRLKLT